jgi:hypothetical protein
VIFSAQSSSFSSTKPQLQYGDRVFCLPATEPTTQLIEELFEWLHWMAIQSQRDAAYTELFKTKTRPRIQFMHVARLMTTVSRAWFRTRWI